MYVHACKNMYVKSPVSLDEILHQASLTFKAEQQPSADRFFGGVNCHIFRGLLLNLCCLDHTELSQSPFSMDKY